MLVITEGLFYLLYIQIFYLVLLTSGLKVGVVGVLSEKEVHSSSYTYEGPRTTWK